VPSGAGQANAEREPGDKQPSLQVAPDPQHRETTSKKPRHEEKVTFYCTGADLTRLERAKLLLRAEQGIASDRGRIVRAALGEILDDFEARGTESLLVRRLQRERAEGES
jgi:hypothetical protein